MHSVLSWITVSRSLQQHPVAALLWFHAGSLQGYRCSSPRCRGRVALLNRPQCTRHPQRNSSASTVSWAQTGQGYKQTQTHALPQNVNYLPNQSMSYINHALTMKTWTPNTCTFTYLLTRSCSFCMGSGSPSRPQVRISLPSYTLIIRSAVFIRKQLKKTNRTEV